MATAVRLQDNFAASQTLVGQDRYEWFLVQGKDARKVFDDNDPIDDMPVNGQVDLDRGMVVYRRTAQNVMRSDPPNEAFIVAIQWRPANWRVGRYEGGYIPQSTYMQWALPVIYNLTAEIQGPGILPYWVYEQKTDVLSRVVSYRVETRNNPGRTLSEIQEFRDKNIGKFYRIGSNPAQNSNTPYILDNINATADRGNNIVVTTYFRTESPIRGFESGYFGYNNLEIPPLKHLESYRPVRAALTGYAPIEVSTLTDLYEPGDPIPWL